MDTKTFEIADLKTALEKVEAKVWPRNYATHASLPYAIDALAYATHAARDTTRAVG